MNLKINNELGSSTKSVAKSATFSRVKEERQRTGRYIAILVGISLFLLAIYHAWVRRIPVVASLLVPALIMFIYVGWVLYTASRDKYKNHLLDLEAANHAPEPTQDDANPSSSNEESPKNTSPDEYKEVGDITPITYKDVTRENVTFIRPIILINDEPPGDIEEVWTNVVSVAIVSTKLKGVPPKRKFKRRFCRSRKCAAFKRSYSIG